MKRQTPLSFMLIGLLSVLTVTLHALPSVNSDPAKSLNPDSSFHNNQQNSCTIPVMQPPAHQTYCHGTATQVVVFSSDVAQATYQWTNSNPSIGLPASGSGHLPSFVAQNPGSATIQATITIIPSIDSCQGSPVSFIISIKPAPDMDSLVNQVVCNGAAIDTIDFNGNFPGTIFTWTNNLPSIGLMPNGTGDIPAFHPINNTLQPVTATITVQPVLDGCLGPSGQMQITVNPMASLVQPLNRFLCNGDQTGTVHFIGTTGATSYTWTNSNTSIGLGSSGTGPVPGFIASNTGNQAVVAQITVTAMYQSCIGVSRTFQIAVDPTPELSIPGHVQVCNGSNTPSIDFSSTVANTSYTWINNTTSIGLAPNGTGNISPFTAINQTDFPITAIIRITGSANSCSSREEALTISVYPIPLVNPVPDQALCNASITDSIQFSGHQGFNGYTWQNDQPSIGLDTAGTGNIPAFAVLNQGQSTIEANITVQAVNPGCAGPGQAFSIRVFPTPDLLQQTDTLICRGASISLQAAQASSYQWTPSQYLSCTDCPSPVSSATGTIRYKVEGISADGCAGSDTILVKVVQRFNVHVPASDTICAGSAFQLSASGAHAYAWSPAESLSDSTIANPVAAPTATTRYRVVGSDQYQCFTDTAYLSITVGVIPRVQLGPDQSHPTGTDIRLIPQLEQGPVVNWSWSPPEGLSCTDCAQPLLRVREDMEYVVSATNRWGCTGKDSIKINAFCTSAQVFIPTGFTPDNDGLNDVLMVRGSGIQVKSFRIFNRWGNLVFEKNNGLPNDARYGWDGKWKGVPVSPDVYVYVVEIICDNGVVSTLKGNTTLIR